MSRSIPFFDLFSDYIPERELRILLLEVLVEEAAVQQDTLTMDLTLLSREMLPEEAVAQVEQELCRLYQLQGVHITVRQSAPEEKKKAAPEGKKRGGAAAPVGGKTIPSSSAATSRPISFP